MNDMLNLTLKIWRQASRDSQGEFKTYSVKRTVNPQG
jgi:hypothetical protein